MAKSAGGQPDVSAVALFRGFLEIALSGFGGALPWARRVLVERREWLTNREFAELLGICQILPGGNIINVSITVGTRFRGPLGALSAFAGLMIAPFLIVSGLGLLYSHGGQLDPVRIALRGVASVAVGMILATGIKLVLPYRRHPAAIVIGGLAFLAVGVLRLPLIPVLLVLAPFSVALAWRRLE